MLTKHTYSVLALIAVLALPSVAVGAGRDGEPAQRIGLGDAHPAALDVLYRPATDFHHAIDVGLKRIRAAHRAEQRRQRREAFATLPGGVSLSTLEAIASCESGGDPTIVSSDGSYRGKYQFSLRNLGLGRRLRRPRRGPRGRAGLPRGAAVRGLGLQPLAHLRLVSAERASVIF